MRDEKKIVGVPVNMLYRREDPPGYPTKGSLWFKPSTREIFIYDGTKWLFVTKLDGSSNDTSEQLTWSTEDW